MREIFKSLVWDQSVNALLVIVFIEAPYLNVWPLRQIITSFTNLMSDKLFEAMTLFVDVSVIKLKNEAHHKEYVRESTKLAIVLHEKGINSDEYKKAREKARLALSRFTVIPRV
jgi:hypothetical protein